MKCAAIAWRGLAYRAVKYFSLVTQGGMKGMVLRKGYCKKLLTCYQVGLGGDISSFSLIVNMVAVSFMTGKIYEAANMILCKPTKFQKDCQKVPLSAATI